MRELEKAFSAGNYEDKIYEQWEKEGYFKAQVDHEKSPFSIAMPPPNATGTLHLGHATMLAIQDIIIRFKRMQGHATLWLPGTDHASIATQNKVEKIIETEGQTRHSLGRENFLKRVDEFVRSSQSIIRRQIRKMGSSCDWSREKYTLDEGLSRAVREVFVKMYEDGLIYRGNRIVNWCTRCESTLADDEVEFREEKTRFYYIKYGPVVIGTARPETKFLDKIIVAHPSDERYKEMFGKKFTIPWLNGNIEAVFIADESADPEFGTGAMTLTPAHDFIDFDIAKKHGFEIEQIIGPDGNFTNLVGEKFAGKNARKSRKEVVQILEQKGLLEKVDENYTHNLSVCYRCGTPVEPLVSKQWFIDVNKPLSPDGLSLKERAIQAVKSEKISIIPERFTKIYFHWMNNLRDWCISRQIWFGHRIPVWYCLNGCAMPIVARSAPKCCSACGGTELTQDADTLDTWFSSGLWTFSTLGWPEKTAELKYFHPTSVMETGYDIIFFWVARMILMSSYVLDDIPFRKVYLHGLVRDRHGNKMSKSKDNGIDPLDMIQKFGTDAVRLSLVMGTSPGNDLRLYEEKISSYRNFVNKIWNSARFTLMNLPDDLSDITFTKASLKTPADKWIVSRLQALIADATRDIEKFALSEAGTRIYNFTWSEFCDWYLEMSKGDNMNSAVLLYVLQTLLRLLHPFVPFVTESIWKHLDQKKMLIASDWPSYDSTLVFEAEESQIRLIQTIITEIRSIRAEKRIDAGKRIRAVIYGGAHTGLIEEKKSIIIRMARLSDIELRESGPVMPNAIWKFVDGVDIYLPVTDLFDIKEEISRLTKQSEQISTAMGKLKVRLLNEGYLNKAPKELIEKEMSLLKSMEEELENIVKKIAELESL